MSRSMNYPTRLYHTTRNDARQFGMQGKNLSVSQKSEIWREAKTRDQEIDLVGEQAAGEYIVDLVAIEQAAEAGHENAKYFIELLGRLASTDIEIAS